MCGSSNIETEIKKEGYDKKKGIRGTILFGLAGALAGTDGNTVTYYHCRECGQVLNHAMSESEKKNIDKCLEVPDAFEESLVKYKAKYKNIEWEKQEKAVELTNEQIETRLLSYMNNIGMPVKNESSFLAKELGIDDNQKYFIGDVLFSLKRRGFIKIETIQGQQYISLLKDNEERNEQRIKLKNAEASRRQADKFAHEQDYAPILVEAVNEKPMTPGEIFVYLKEKSSLPEHVIKYAEGSPDSDFGARFIIHCYRKYKDEVEKSCGAKRAAIIYEDGVIRSTTQIEKGK
jgi:hypothetical protein